jgi:NAD(P)H-dependent FMN reductase
MPKKIKILAISGSLRTNSSNTMLVKAISHLLPDSVDCSIYNGLGNLPLFDDNDITPNAVEDFREQILSADGVIICSPEYAFGISGALKNALEWTVSSGDFLEKPVAIITAALSGEKAHASLLQIFDALAAKIVDGGTLIIPFIRTKLSVEAEITDEPTLQEVKSVLNALISDIQHG